MKAQVKLPTKLTDATTPSTNQPNRIHFIIVWAKSIQDDYEFNINALLKGFFSSVSQINLKFRVP